MFQLIQPLVSLRKSLRKEDEAKRAVVDPRIPKGIPPAPDVVIVARVTRHDGVVEVPLIFKPGGKRLNVGRVSDNDLSLNETSVSKIHATLLLNNEGTLLVADTGSTNGTYINGRRIAYGEARQIEAGDVVGFGDVEVRFKRD